MGGERVGIGRVYAQVDGRLTFSKWIQSIADGRSYVSDGFCHLLGFSATSAETDAHVRIGLNGSELKLESPAEVTFAVDGAALINDTSAVRAELIINGYPVADKRLKADGSIREVTFKHTLKQSGWAAIRVFPHAHTNPIYVVVNGNPIQGTVDSARWCLAGVEQCWKSKQNTYAEDEQADAKAAYDHARKFYQELIDGTKDE